jgi:hypothetical protein
MEDLAIQQNLSGYTPGSVTPQVGVRPSQSWPLNYDYDAHLMAHGADLANDAKAQNKLDLKGAKKHFSRMQIPQAPQGPSQK